MMNLITLTALGGLAVAPFVMGAPLPKANPLDPSQFGAPAFNPSGANKFAPLSNAWIPGGLPPVIRPGGSVSESGVVGGDAANGGFAGSRATADRGSTSVSPNAGSNVSGPGSRTDVEANARTMPTNNGGAFSFGTASSVGFRDAQLSGGLQNLKDPHGNALNQVVDNQASTVAFSWDAGDGTQPFTFSNTVGTANGRPISATGKKHKK